MNKNNELFSGILFISILLVLVSNFFVFLSYKEQQKIINDMKYLYPEVSIQEAETYNYNYPNLNVFTQPLKNYLGRVYLREGKYEEAIELFQIARKENPYLLINENFLADVYRNLKINDSVNYYSRIAFEGMPNNSLHYEGYLQTLKNDDTIEFDNAFDKILHKDNQIWIAYLASGLKLNYKSQKLKENIKIAQKEHYKVPAIRLLVDYHLYGRENIDQSIKLIEEGVKLMNERQHYESLTPLLKAYELNQKNNDLLFNISSSYFIIGNFIEAKKFIDQIDIQLLTKEDLGKFYFAKGIIYSENEINDIGCDLLTESIKENFNQAYNAKLKYCD